MRRAAWLLLTCWGCAPPPPIGQPTAATVVDPCAATLALYAWQDLPKDDPRSHGLSGLAWDERDGVLYAVPDKDPVIQKLIPDADFKHWRFGDPLPVHIDARWDVEALAVSPDRFYLGNEAGPWIHSVARDGTAAGPVPLPDAYTGSRHNHGLESLTLTPDGRTLIVANEHAFTPDGPEADGKHGTVVRLTRIDVATGKATMQPYLTEQVFVDVPDGRVGVVDIMAPSANVLYVTERAYAPGHGNDVKIFCVNGDAPKRLLLDFTTLPSEGVPKPYGPQRNPILENYEGLSLGPSLPDGRRLIFVVSDDNGTPKQTPRLLVLALTPPRP